MSVYKKDELLLLMTQQMEAVLIKAISEWQLTPHSKFSLKPNAKSWSANECLQHLNSYGNYYLPAIERAIKDEVNLKSSHLFYSGWLGNYFTKLMLPEKTGMVSKKVKAPTNHSPKQILESHLVVAEFIDQQERLIQLLQKVAEIDLNRSKVGISIAPFIKLKLGDALMFLVAHIQRHSIQADGALKKAGSENSDLIFLNFDQLLVKC